MEDRKSKNLVTKGICEKVKRGKRKQEDTRWRKEENEDSGTKASGSGGKTEKQTKSQAIGKDNGCEGRRRRRDARWSGVGWSVDREQRGGQEGGGEGEGGGNGNGRVCFYV